VATVAAASKDIIGAMTADRIFALQTWPTLIENRIPSTTAELFRIIGMQTAGSMNEAHALVAMRMLTEHEAENSTPTAVPRSTDSAKRFNHLASRQSLHKPNLTGASAMATYFPDDLKYLAELATETEFQLKHTLLILAAWSTELIFPDAACRLLKLPVQDGQTPENLSNLLREFQVEVRTHLQSTQSVRHSLAIVSDWVSS